MLTHCLQEVFYENNNWVSISKSFFRISPGIFANIIEFTLSDMIERTVRGNQELD